MKTRRSAWVLIAGAGLCGCTVTTSDPDEGEAGTGGDGGGGAAGGTTSGGAGGAEASSATAGAGGDGAASGDSSVAGRGSGGAGGHGSDGGGGTADPVGDLLDDPAVQSALAEARDQGVDIVTHTEHDPPDPSGYYSYALGAGEWIASGNGDNVGNGTAALEMRVTLRGTDVRRERRWLRADGAVDRHERRVVRVHDGFCGQLRRLTSAEAVPNEGTRGRGPGPSPTPGPSKRVVEREDVPGPGRVATLRFPRRSSGVALDDLAPERDRARVSADGADRPAAAQLLPDLPRSGATDTLAAKAPQYEELGDVEDARVVARGGAAFGEDEACHAPVDVKQERKSVARTRQIRGQRRVPVAPAGAELDLGKDRAQVVNVELEEVLEQLRVGGRYGAQATPETAWIDREIFGPTAFEARKIRPLSHRSVCRLLLSRYTQASLGVTAASGPEDTEITVATGTR